MHDILTVPVTRSSYLANFGHKELGSRGIVTNFLFLQNIWPIGQVVKTSGFHPGNLSSTLGWATNKVCGKPK